MSARILAALAVVGILGVSPAPPAVAQGISSGQEGKLGALLPPVPGRAVCFARRYDADHLAAHPAQTITSMVLRVRYHRHAPDDSYPQGLRHYYFTVVLDRRGRKGRLTTSGECTNRNAIACTVECDGGGFGLNPEPGGTVLVDLTRYGRLRLSRGCDEEDGVVITPGRDDRRFRLEPVPVSQCAFPEE